jgi:hypothetical protein
LGCDTRPLRRDMSFATTAFFFKAAPRQYDHGKKDENRARTRPKKKGRQEKELRGDATTNKRTRARPLATNHPLHHHHHPTHAGSAASCPAEKLFGLRGGGGPPHNAQRGAPAPQPASWLAVYKPGHDTRHQDHPKPATPTPTPTPMHASADIRWHVAKSRRPLKARCCPACCLLPGGLLLPPTRREQNQKGKGRPARTRTPALLPAP